MQKILGLDIAGGNIIAAVFAVEGDSVSTLEHYSIPLKRKNDTNEDSSQEVESSFFINLSDSFKEVIRKIQNKYSRSFLIIPPYNYLSTDIELPFFNPKAIEKILELEIQDLVSLDVNEFHIAPYIFDDNTKKDNAKVHIGMLPKKFMNEITSEAKKVELEPYIITTRATSLSALYYLYKELNKNSAIVSLSDNILSITASCDGNVCYDRAVLLENKNESIDKHILQDIQIAIYALEKQYNTKIECIYTPNNDLVTFLKDAKFSRDVFLLDFSNINVSINNDLLYLYLTSVFVRDFNPPPILTNFRCRKYAYKLQLKELRRGLINLLPIFLFFLFIISLFLFAKYKLLDYRINTTRSAIQHTIRDYIPSLSKDNQATIEQVMQEQEELERELKNLSTDAVMSPIEAFRLISEDFSIITEQKKDISISQLHITQKDAKFTIETADYKGMGAVERQFKRRLKQQYCKIDSKDKSSMHASRKSFEFLVEFCKK